MLRNRVYYRVKPFIPQSLRAAVRRRVAARLRDRVQDIWPIIPGSEKAPKDWPGWPHGKKFALVLTHDVEGKSGLQNCRKLMKLEMEFGLRSSFNFIPEGSYHVPRELREELVNEGFEVGVHDLRHDGRLFASRREFKRRAARINDYLREWGAVGFRSGFMLHELDWLHELNIGYDASTFDTDPFEPQPQGRHTIFPFWIWGPAESSKSEIRELAGYENGYVELPYTLPQDSTLFLLLGEPTIDVWKRKLDWIVKHGGMALVNVHPDYINFGASNGSNNHYPVARIREFLSYIVETFPGEFWNPSCKELSDWYSRLASERLRRSESFVPVTTDRIRSKLSGKRAAVLLYSYFPADPRPRRAAEALIDAGMEVDLFCLRDKPSDALKENIGGVQIVRLPLQKRRHSKGTYILQYTAFLLACFGLLAVRSLKRRYDLVHVHNMPDALVFAALVPKLLGARVILDLHDPMPELMMSIYNVGPDATFVRWLRRLEKFSIAFADFVLTPNKAFRNLFVSRGCRPEKIQIVMNSPESKIFTASGDSRPVDGSDEKPYRIMYHGLIAERHGLDVALNAIAYLREAIPDLEFHIFGDRTAYMDKVEAQVGRLNLQSSVHYHGYQPQHEIAQAIRAIDIGIIPNRRNPFTEINMPTRIFEYLAIGKPVVVPDTQGIRDYFEKDSLIFFEPDNPQSLGDAILKAYRDPMTVNSIVTRGRAVYEHQRWETHRSNFLDRVSALLSPTGTSH
ncbi:MAG TPA: glycosyltransferase [Terriglobales bacterium]|nr:glycosyltransferase [Terriglobales bacterium]